MIKVLSLVSILALSSEVSAACKGSSQSLKASNSIRCEGDLSSTSVAFTHSSPTPKSLYISGESHSGCGDFPSYLWEEVDLQGAVLSSQDANQGMDLVPGKFYHLRVVVREPGCRAYGMAFSVAAY